MAESGPAEDWVALAEADEPARAEAMAEGFQQLLAVSEDERVGYFEEMLRAEHELLDEAHLRLTLSRLMTWVRLRPEAIATLATSLDVARERLPGPMAMRSIAGLQSVLRDMSHDNVAQLIEAAPSFRVALPPEMREAFEVATHQEEATPGRTRRRFWRVWRH